MDKNKKILTEEDFLKNYDPNLFDRPSVTVDNVIFSVFKKDVDNYRKNPEKNLYLLLVKRAEHPFIDKWALPGGFVRINESVEEGAYRELKEETNIEKIYMEQLYTFGAVDRDPRMRIISTSYMALIKADSVKLKPDTDVLDVSWFKLNYEFNNNDLIIKLENYDINLSVNLRVKQEVRGESDIEILDDGNLAFDHAKIIGYALIHLKNKVKYTNIVFNLMPEFFTLTELQEVYEIILGKKLIAANFRRKIKDLVIETEKFSDEAGHRPSKLYKFNTDIVDI